MGCQNTALQPPIGDKQGIATAKADLKNIDDARAAFLADKALAKTLPTVLAFENQALQLLQDEPLKLGAIGTAVIELRPNSLTGHYALKKFYEYVETDAGVDTHRQKLDHLYNHIKNSGDGSQKSPYKIVTKNDAAVFALLQKNKKIVGEIYQTTESHPLGLMTLARANPASPLESTVFDLSDLLQPLADLGAPQEVDSPWSVLRLFADENDRAAQASIGTYLAKQQRYDSATGWLELSSRGGNMLANTLLARIYGYLAGEEATNQSDTIDAPKVSKEEFTRLSIQNHRQAIALGSVESMYTLGRLYIESMSNDAYLKRDIPQGVELLERAGALGNARAYLFLAYQNASGKLLERDETKANEYFAAAAQLKNPSALISYARFLVSFNQLKPDEQLLPLLTELAAQDNAKAMVALGNLKALGIGSKMSVRQAVSWYKKAVRSAQASHHEAADVINEVAWTLTATQIKPLQRSRYAQKIMDAMMEKNPQASSHPEYLDTWANTYAANGDFSKAVALQKQAIASAYAQKREDILDILNDHLAKFMAGKVILEPTP